MVAVGAQAPCTRALCHYIDLGGFTSRQRHPPGLPGERGDIDASAGQFVFPNSRHIPSVVPMLNLAKNSVPSKGR